MSAKASTWCRADVLRAICDVQRPDAEMPARALAGRVGAGRRPGRRALCRSRPDRSTKTRRRSDGRSVWIEPTAPGLSSEAVLAEEEAIVAWAIDAQLAEPEPSTTVRRRGVGRVPGRGGRGGRRPRPAGVGGRGRPGPARRQCAGPGPGGPAPAGRPVFGLAPTAKAARTLQRDRPGSFADTVAKLLYEVSTRPGTGSAVPAADGDHGDRRRGRDDQHRRPAPPGRPGRAQRVAAGAGRRPPPAAGRRPGWPVRRTAAPTAGSTRSNTSTGSPTPGRPKPPSMLRAGDPRGTRRLRGARPDHPRHPGRAPRRDRHRLGRPSPTAGTRWRWWPPPTSTSTCSTTPSRHRRLSHRRPRP